MKNLLYIGNNISKHGFNKTTVETLSQSLKEEGYNVIITSSKKNQFFRLFDMILSTFLKANKVDCILIDTYSTSSFWYAFFCSQIARLFQTKYIPILHGGNLPNRLTKNPKLSKMVFSNSFVNIAPSNYLQTAFQTAGFQNTMYIPNVLEIKKYIFKKRETFEPKILWVRAFAQIYNPKMAIDVFQLVSEKYPNAQLCMVGPDKDGSLLSTQKYAVDLNLNVLFTGGLPKQEWLELAKDFDVFINTTHIDNTPISVMEAMALGLAVISTNVGGIPFLLKDNKDSLLVNDSDSSSMANKIVQIIQNPIFSTNLTMTARAKVETFDWENVKKLWNNLLK